MKQIITAKLKLYATAEQFQALRTTQLAYRDALNFVSRYAFANGKLSNQHKLQQACYDTIRQQFKLPAQMACNVPRQVGATYKGLWTKVKKNTQHRKAGWTKKRYKGLDQAPHFVSPTLTYNYGRDYSFKKERRVSVLTLDGRIVVGYNGYAPHVEWLKQNAQIGAAKLWYDKLHKQFYLLVTLERTLPDPTPASHTSVVGVDVGMRYLAVSTDTQERSRFFSGKQVVARANHYARLRKRLQRKGTRAATRRLRAISGRERRLKLNVNHVVATRIVAHYPHALIGLESLADIRERTKSKKGQRASPRQRKSNGVRSKWSFAELQSLIAYKALLNGSMAIKVEAHYTSQACPRCGHTSPDNRPEKGLMFVCQNCHYTLHADLVGARNIAMRTLLFRQDWNRTGVLSEPLDVSDTEAKAALLQRYAELRWSPDTSLNL